MVERFGDSVNVEGNICDKGAEFAEAEIYNPTRTLTTTVRTSFPGVPVLPVRTDGEIPKGKIMDAMAALSKVVVGHDLDCGDTVIEDIVGTGVRVIATSDALKRRDRQYAKQKKQSGTGGGSGSPGGSTAGYWEFGAWDSELDFPLEELAEGEDQGVAGKDGALSAEEAARRKQDGRPHIKSKPH